MQVSTVVRAAALAAVATALVSPALALANTPPEVGIAGLAPTAREAMPLEGARFDLAGDLSDLVAAIRERAHLIEKNVEDAFGAVRLNARHAVDEAYLQMEHQGSPLR